MSFLATNASVPKTTTESEYINDDTAANKLKTWKTQVADLEKETKILQFHVDTLYSMSQGL
ncbi:hypothetical protein PN36_02280 [Candidatus Thiomargarita nelsonii]|uniref:Uncharacterized protein n=1 Tax=Candidatus Thiomargarita nelsonii TaxID=1003181 RepID=A0A0A6RSA5_9GAMM|nr:hypothetical protein PN36_02280 [Candidatus Thiomargarita nelsonii]